MRYGHLLGVLGAAFLVQTTAASFVRLWGVVPDVLLAVVVSYGLLFGPIVGLGAGVAAGAALDVAIGRLMGLHVLTLGLAGLVAGQAERFVVKENVLLPLVGGAAGGLLTGGLTLGILLYFGWPLSPAQALRETILPGAILSGGLTTLVYLWLLGRYTYFRPDPRGAVAVRPAPAPGVRSSARRRRVAR